MPRVFIRKGPDGEFPSPNFALAYQGFKELGCEIVFYKQTSDIDPTVEDVVVDYIDQSREIIARLGRTIEELGYPKELDKYLGRLVWESTVDNVAIQPELWPVFIKPKGLKVFTGRLVNNLSDLRGTRAQEEDTPIWVSSPVTFIAEWRCFVRYGKAFDLRRYKGSWSLHPDTLTIRQAVNAYESAPAGCSLDFGLTSDLRTVLVEVNEGHSLGAYGCYPLNYAKILTARWSEIMGVPDPFRDLEIFT